MYDIFFISYNEPNAEKNWQSLKTRFPFTKRVDNIKGIHTAHKLAAEQSLTKMFWVVDADAVVKDSFDFSFKVEPWDLDAVHVWYSENPINGLEYGYGGVKLLPKQLTKDINLKSVDMTTSISSKFKIVPVVSNVTEFNTDPFNTWKSAFRESVKLASGIINGNNAEESKLRLDVWTTVGKESKFGEYSIKGALQGKHFAEHYLENISKINDFDWLQQEFLKVTV